VSPRPSPPVRRPLLPLLTLLTLVSAAGTAFAFTPSGLLEIHTINVQQGDCTLVIGPDGTTLLIDGGNGGKGTAEVVPYLQSIGLLPADGLDYMLASHQDSDHLGGLDEVINAGYDVRLDIWDNGSNETGTQITQFENAAATTTAGPVTAIALGATIALGNGATARCVAVGGQVLGHGTVSGASNNENDLSIALLVQYGGFDYLTAGDLGGGEWSVDRNCTGRTTGQVNVETPLAQALMPGGGAALLTADGIEVLHVNHHGSESSTNHQYMNLLTPSVALIHTGSGQGSTYHHPRIDVVENVLLAGAACVTAAPAFVLQTEEGSPTGANTSFAGYCVGDVVITTSGVGTYTVSATGAVSQGPDERAAAGLNQPADFPLEGVSDTTPPVVAVLAPNGGESWAAGSARTITWSASDDIGVTGIDLAYSATGSGGPFTNIALGEPNDGSYAWTVPNDPSSNVVVRVTARDAAGNSAADLSDAAFTITAPPAPALHVHGLIVDNVSSGGGRWNGRATITVHDQNHAPVSGVVVTGNWSGLVVQNGVTGTTNGSGVATITSAKKKNPSGQFCFDVTNLAAGGYSYDLAADIPQTPPAVCGPTLGGALAVSDILAAGAGGGSAVSIQFRIEEPSHVRVRVFDLTGRLVDTLLDAPTDAGTTFVRWEASDRPSGVYFLRVETDVDVVGRKVILAR
jgi:beta-lactamase superfamily II metal-dependent hydrolase